MSKKKNLILNRDTNWLAFNARVLQEAMDPEVPLLERIKFLGIFASNYDEFFRVRVATLKRASKLGKKAKKILGEDPKKILAEIHTIVLQQTDAFGSIYQQIRNALEEQNIILINEHGILAEHQKFILDYFRHHIYPALVPIMLDYVPNVFLKDQSLYLAVSLSRPDDGSKTRYALIEIPTDVLPRFLVLPLVREKQYIILLDDVIRYCLPEIFAIFSFEHCAAYTIKMTRDAELNLENDALESYIEKISKSVKNRKKGQPVQFTYDRTIPPELLNLLVKKLKLKKNDELTPGDSYHNFKDFMNFPHVGTAQLKYEPMEPLPHKKLEGKKSILKVMRKKDFLLHYPFHSFDYMISLLREAAIDPKVISIKMTLYRLAKQSNVVNALIQAVKNGTAVTVVVELQARFDEEANIYWANKLEESGARVIYGVPNYKVHAKLCLITRKEEGQLRHYVNISTGNYNEVTARAYCDSSLFTSNPCITKEVEEIFDFFEDNILPTKYKHLLVSPFHMRNKLVKLINNEIHNARNGKQASILLKVNSLVDAEMIDKLYEASNAGVKIRLIIRGSCSLIPGVPDLSANIEAISIIDRFLEHSRVFVFGNGGDELYYISSADWMNRNLSHRIEVACPIYDKAIQEELRTMLELQLQDNVKARILNKEQDNRYKKTPSAKVRSQVEIYRFLQKEHQL